MKRLVIILFFCISLGGIALAQYFPVFSQYLTNGLVLNPAYTGSREVLSINLMYRNQMLGFEGAPVFQTFSAHAPLKNANVGVGVLFLNEQSGPIRNTQAYFNYAYRVHMGRGRMALGIKAGVNYGQYNWNNFNLNEADPAFTNNNNSFILPNVGAGVFYYSRRFFTGFSIPYILSYKEKSTRNGYSVTNDANNYSFLLTAGYLVDISRGFKLKPSALLKYYVRYPQQLDLNLNVILLNDKLWLGTAYRINEAVAGMFEIQFNPQFRLGYTFEYAGQKVSYFNYTSHEISLRYEFSYKIKAFNPRYF